MNALEFVPYLLADSASYLSILAALSLVFFLLFRTVFASVLDPLFFFLLSFVFSESTVLFLFHLDMISAFYLHYNLLCTSLLLGSFLFICKSKISLNLPDLMQLPVTKIGNLSFVLVLFYFSIFVFVCSKCTEYALLGIPVITKNSYQVGTGLGFLTRLSDGSIPLVCFSTFYIFDTKSRNFVIVFLIFLAVILMFLTGSRGQFIGVLQLWFCYTVFFRKRQFALFSSKKIMFALFLALAFGLILFYFQSQDLEMALIAPFIRLAYFGDIYIYSYVNNGLEVLKSASFFKGVVVPLLSVFRLGDVSQADPHIGYSLFNHFNPSMGYAGPNARFDVFGLYYFGYIGGSLFSLFLGVFAGFARFLLVNFKGGFILFIICMLFYSLTSASVTDPMLALTSLINYVFVSGSLLLAAFFVCKSQSFNKKQISYG